MFWAGLTISLAVTLITNNMKATDGQKLYDLWLKQEELRIENGYLAAQLANKKSLVTAQKQARALGFDKPKRIVIIK